MPIRLTRQLFVDILQVAIDRRKALPCSHQVDPAGVFGSIWWGHVEFAEPGIPPASADVR